jgi:peptidase E
MKQRQILAIGGRFYVDTWEPPLLQRHLLSLCPAQSPRICLLAGAVGDNPNAIEQFYRRDRHLRLPPTHLNIYKPITRDFADYFTAMDIIYVNGGSTRNLVTVWRDWGIDKALRSAWEQGVVMSGTSAGMNCWFEACITDSHPPEMLPLSCIGLLSGSACAHYTKRPDRAPTFRRMIAEATIPGAWLWR